jgi:L-ascorbate metabolism protein UlaG (beta-lactamase superfamily)
MKMTWFGHSCFRIETGKSVLLIDPFLKGSPTFQKSGVSFEAATKGVTHVARGLAPRCLPITSWRCT